MDRGLQDILDEVKKLENTIRLAGAQMEAEWTALAKYLGVYRIKVNQSMLRMDGSSEFSRIYIRGMFFTELLTTAGGQWPDPRVALAGVKSEPQYLLRVLKLVRGEA